MNRLYGKVAIVTGGGTGIGEAICKKFALEGATVIVNGYPEDPVYDVVKDIQEKGGNALAYIGDISEKENAKECIELTIKKYGRIDILVNNAGVWPQIDELTKYEDDATYYMIKNNIMSGYFMTKTALPYLQKTKGNIIFAGSESGEKGLAYNVVYGGTKGFIHAFVKGLAVEQAKHGVRVNAVCPGPIDTAWTHDEYSDLPVKLEKMFLAATPMGRRGMPEEVANVYCFLASDEATYVTGSLYFVDGGITVGKGPVGAEVPNKLRKEPKSQIELHHKYEGAVDMSR
jgi:NAD(P)-dependent dehydrogenase (short-subunit alcohol dehydrogenase family)